MPRVSCADGDGNRRHGASQAQHQHDLAPVDAVGQQADGVLQQGAAENGGADEPADIALGFAAGAGEYRAQRPEAAHHHTGQQRPGEGRAGAAIQQAKPDAGGFNRGGCQPAGQPNRDNGQSQEHCRQGKGRGGLHWTHVDQQLAKRHRHQHDKGIDRQNPAAGFHSGLVIEPALYHGIQAGNRHPGNKTQSQQKLPGVQHIQAENGTGHERGQHCETADVPHPGDNGGYTDTTDDKTQEITGGADPDHEI